MMFRNDGEIPEALARQKIHIDPLLAEGLNFDSHDLMLNRDNLLSDRQKQGLEYLKAREFWDITILFYVAATVYVFLVVLVFLLTDPTIGNILINGVIFLCILVPPPILIIYIGRNMIQTTNPFAVLIGEEIKAGVVASLSGTIILENREQRGQGASEKYFLTVNKREFKITREAFLRFKHLENYTIYYTPNSKIIVSAEPV